MGTRTERLCARNSQLELPRSSPGLHFLEDGQLMTRKWYFSKEEIELFSPSRKDGIACDEESHLRTSYCTFLQELGMELKVPQVTIATALMLCHRFYMRQSHGKNDWQTVATISMYLACKAEETPRRLNDLIAVSYTLIYRWDPSSAQRIRQKEVYDKQKELILIGERLLLVTVAFDLNIESPYKPLVAALKKMEIPQKEIVKVAWNFVNDWLRTTLCLQFKPHYIAAGSIYLAAKFLKVKLPPVNGQVWWMQFDVLPKQLEDVVQQMLDSLDQNRRRAVSSQAKVMASKPVSTKEKSTSPRSCISNELTIAASPIKTALTKNEQLVESAVSKGSEEQACSDVDANPKEVSACQGQARDCCSANSIIDDDNGEPRPGGESNEKSCCKVVPVENNCVKMDLNHIREKIKRKKCGGAANKPVELAVDDEIGSEGWIEKELERGLEIGVATVKKRLRL